ncbi:hypothetical protein QQG55_10565 [Brugia pahangi]
MSANSMQAFLILPLFMWCCKGISSIQTLNCRRCNWQCWSTDGMLLLPLLYYSSQASNLIKKLNIILSSHSS